MPSRPADPALEARIEAAFGPVRPLLTRFALLCAAVMGIAFVAFAAKTVIEVNAPNFPGSAIRIDFAAFWAAAKLALQGHALDAFDADILQRTMDLPPSTTEGDLMWLYPPAWFIAIMPLGFMPFSVAFLVYSVVTFAAFAAAIRPMAAPLPGGIALVLGGPSVLVIIMLGNMSLVWTAGLVGALGAMMQGRTVLAGLLIALLTVKPQLGVLIPFALVAAGQWRMILWAAAGTVVLVAASTAVMGIDYWPHFFGWIGKLNALMATDNVRFERMITWLAMVRLGGGSKELANAVQIAATAGCILSVAWVWRRPVTWDLKAAILCAAIPLATPYAYHYEMILTLAAAMFLARDGFGATRGERLWLLALWLGPVPGLALLGHFPPGFYAAPLVTATVLICLWRARASHAGQELPQP